MQSKFKFMSIANWYATRTTKCRRGEGSRKNAKRHQSDPKKIQDLEPIDH